MTASKRFSWTYRCLSVHFWGWTVVICCAVTVGSCETRSSYFARTTETNNLGEVSDAEFSCAALCTATRGCKKAIINNKNGWFCSLKAEEKPSELSGSKGDVQLQKASKVTISHGLPHVSLACVASSIIGLGFPF